MIRYFVLLLTVTFLYGCSTTYQVKTFSKKTNQNIPSYRVKQNEIIKDNPMAINKYRKLLVVGIKGDTPCDYDTQKKFWVQSLINLGYFRNVVAIEDLPNYLINNGQGDSAPSGLIDLIALHKLEKNYGNFLFADISDNCVYDNCNVVFKIIDPRTAKTYFGVKREITNWVGLDHYLFYPILNSFGDWVKKNEKQG